MTQKQYLNMMKKIANKNGYTGTLKIANDGIHKLIYNNVPFGRSGYMDYILYLLTENKKIAQKHRSNYLSRSGKIIGNWKKYPNSPNNLSRIIIWDANNKLFK